MGWKRLHLSVGWENFHKSRRNLPANFFLAFFPKDLQIPAWSLFTNSLTLLFCQVFLLDFFSPKDLQIPTWSIFYKSTDPSLLSGSVQGGRHLPRRLGQKDNHSRWEGDAWTYVSHDFMILNLTSPHFTLASPDVILPDFTWTHIISPVLTLTTPSWSQLISSWHHMILILINTIPTSSPMICIPIMIHLFQVH